MIEPNGIGPAKSRLSIWARSQHGIEARVLAARLFASMRQSRASVAASMRQMIAFVGSAGMTESPSGPPLRRAAAPHGGAVSDTPVDEPSRPQIGIDLGTRSLAEHLILLPY